MERKIQIYNYVFNLLLEEHSNKVTCVDVHMKGRLPADITEDETKQAGIYRSEIMCGLWDWLIARERMITLPIYNILVMVDGVIYDGSVRYRGGSIQSSLKEICPYCGNLDCDFDCPESDEWKNIKDALGQESKGEELRSNSNYNYGCDAIEAMIINHAIAGVNIEGDAYIEGLESAVDAVANNL